MKYEKAFFNLKVLNTKPVFPFTIFLTKTYILSKRYSKFTNCGVGAVIISIFLKIIKYHKKCKQFREKISASKVDRSKMCRCPTIKELRVEHLLSTYNSFSHR